MKAILAFILLGLTVSTVWAAGGCPAGTKHLCVQTKSGVQCYCR